MKTEETHKVVKVRIGTYLVLRKLAAQEARKMTAILDRLVLAEWERQSQERKDVTP